MLPITHYLISCLKCCRCWTNHVLLNQTHPLFFQVVSHLLVLMFSQFLVSILVIFCEYCLNLCISMALPEMSERLQMNSSMHTIHPKHSHTDMREERRNCWVRASPLTFQKDTTSETNVSLWVLGLEGDSALRIYLYVRTFPAMANWDSYPLRSCRSSSKFNLPPPCRRLSEMSSTVFFFSLSLIKALW